MSPPALHRIGIGTDLHALAPGRPLVLGSVRIPFEKGPLGHSDGDVVLHALIDAVSGAAGMPDIGEQFPDSDPRHRDADSRDLVRHTLHALRTTGHRVACVDLIIHAEKPKLSAYKDAIRRSVAELLGLDPARVAIKAKTNEGLDAVGRGEAIACTAVVGLVLTDSG